MYPNTQLLQLGARVRAQLQSAPAPSPERRGCLETVELRFKPAGPGFTMAKFVLAGEWSPRPPADRSKHRQLLSSYDRLPVIFLTGLCSSNSSLYMDHPGFIMLSFKNVCWAVTVQSTAGHRGYSEGKDTSLPSRSFQSPGIQKHVSKYFWYSVINAMRGMCTGLWGVLQELICEGLE